MTFLVKEIPALELNRSVTLSRGASFGKEGCIVEPKLGRLQISIPEGASEVVLHARRISGNGKISVVVHGNSVPHSIYSKVSQCLDFPVVGQTFEILRPDGTGEICILGLEFFSPKQPKKSEQGDLVQKWKSIIARCGEYKHLRMVGSRLFAARGATIENSSVIINITTTPVNAFIRKGTQIYFVEPCEILGLELDPNVPLSSLKTSTDVFQHLEAPMPVVAPEPPPETPAIRTPLVSAPMENDVLVPINRVRPPIVTRVDYVMYDSLVNNDFDERRPVSSDSIKFIKSNGKGFLLLQRTGLYSVPISALQPNTEYIAAVTLKKLNGNGKINVGFIDQNKIIHNPQTIHASNMMNEVHITIRTPNETGANTLRFGVGMDKNGVGEVLISRLMLIENLPIQQKTIATPAISAKNQHRLRSPAAAANGVMHSRKRFVIVIPSYKNENWCEQNIISTINQNYENYRVIFTDDCSPDNTFRKVSEIVNASDKCDKFTLIKNPTRKGALANLYTMIQSCDDNEIILTLDGDDWLANSNVLSTLNNIYADDNVWMTYGQYQNYPDGGTGISQQIPEHIISSGNFRQFTWCASHLRTFYTWLFREIEQKDLCYENNFMAMTWDMAMMFPMLEMAGPKSRFIKETLYVYNMDNPINDHKVNVKLQHDLDRYVRRLPRYPRMNSPITHDMPIGLMLIATGKYRDYVQGIISSADNYFLKNMNVTYYLFTDTDHSNFNIKTERRLEQIQIEHRPFPFASMDRFQHFTNHADKLSREKYLYYVDVDCLFVDNVFTEIIGDLVGVCHCGYMNKPGPLETNTQSTLYVDESLMRNYKYYFGGGFSGGKTEKYLELARWCSENITKDVDAGVMPIWHDETAINRYFLEHEPDIVLSPSYHYPQGQINYYLAMWPTHYPAKILLLDKNHKKMRQ